jgi:hypothetical protein
MEIVFSIITIIFVGIVLGLALTFGLVLIVWLVGLAMIVTAISLLRGQLRRWRFVRNAEYHEKNDVRIIDADYKDITDHK